jgi:hypothetical protein
VIVPKVAGLLTELGYTITLVSVEAGIVQARMELPASYGYASASRSWRVACGDSIRIFPAISIYGGMYGTEARDQPIALNLFDSLQWSWVVAVADRVKGLCPSTDASGQ